MRLSSTHEQANLTRVGFSYPRFLEVRERQLVFSDIALSAGNAFTLTGKGDPEQVDWLFMPRRRCCRRWGSSHSWAATSRRMKTGRAASASC